MSQKVNVYNDGELVFAGPLSQFLADNDHDEELTEACRSLPVEFNAFSGSWLIESAE